mgnify:CR=1 FL=1
MNKKKITALLLSSVMALTPAMPAMAEQSTIIDYVDGTTDSTVETPDVTPTPLPEKKEGWETVDGVKYYYVNGEKITNKVKKIGKYTYCFDKTGKTRRNLKRLFHCLPPRRDTAERYFRTFKHLYFIFFRSFSSVLLSIREICT